MYKQLKNKVLSSYNGDFSGDSRISLRKRIHQFNVDHGTHFWVDMKPHGSANLWSWICIREHGDGSTILYIRPSKRLHKIFSETIARLKKLKASEGTQLKLF